MEDAQNQPRRFGIPQMQFNNPFVNIPQATKILAIVMAVMYLIGTIFPFVVRMFAMVPGYTFPPHFRFWNLATAGFMHTSLLDLLFNVVLLVIAGKYLEPLWGTKEYLRFIAIVNSVCWTFMFAVLVLMYQVSNEVTTKDGKSFNPERDILFHPVGGFAAVIAGFAVAMKELNPEQDNKLFGVLSVRNKHIPSIMMLTTLIFSLISFSAALFVVIPGVIASWVYLRWFQAKPGEVVGNPSNDFSFASFFPESVQPTVNTIANLIWVLGRSICCCVWRPPRATTTIASTGERELASAPSVLSAPADAERRRMMALKALDARLAQVKQTSTRPLDNIAPVTTIDTTVLTKPANTNNTNINNTNPVQPEDQV
jgi:membrane associated rhomboid family serine protease